MVWVTGVDDGKARPGARVTLLDFSGREIGTTTTDERGIANFVNINAKPPTVADEPYYSGFEGYVIVTLGADRALTGVSEYDPDLSPWNFNVETAYGPSRIPVAGAVFTERGIYRPGETVQVMKSRGDRVRLLLATVPHQERSVREITAAWPERPEIFVGEAAKWQAFAMADAALAASGTVLLELALTGIPTISTYKTDVLIRMVLNRIKVWSGALPNLIAIVVLRRLAAASAPRVTTRFAAGLGAQRGDLADGRPGALGR